MAGRAARRTTAGAVLVLQCVAAGPAAAQDAVERLMQRGVGPADAAHRHAYSDFSDPLGRFMDMLAAGAFGEARAIQPAACAAWLATRHSSPLTGRFRVWDAEIDLDTLCPPG